jgi:tetratricopeptide (TPR) repeat protein
MYLRGSKWSVARQRKRGNPVRILFWGALLIGALYINAVVVPTTPPLFIPTATPTRSPESFLSEAQNLVGKGKINQAITTYQDAIKADPTNPAIYVSVARLQVLYGDYPGAMENVENALLLNPNHALARAVRGWVLSKQKDYLAGEAELKNALELDPNSGLAWAYYAELLKDQLDEGRGDFNTQDKAAQYSKKALDLDPSQLEVHRARGLVLEVTGNYGEAIKEFEQVLTMNQNLSEIYVALARNYRVHPEGAPQYDRAVEALNTAIALRPDVAEPYAELARTYLTVGDYQKGIQIAQQAVEREPGNALMHGLLGTLYYRLEQYEPASQSFRLALNGGMTNQGKQVIPVANDGGYTYTMYSSRYGIALANIGQCNEALQVAQQQSQIAMADYLETAQINAQVMVDICREVADRPAVTSTPAIVTPTPGQ